MASSPKKGEVKKEHDARICQRHNQKFVCWCDDCNEFTCISCIRWEHSECEVRGIDDMFPNIKKYLYKKVQQTVPSEESTINALQSMIKKKKQHVTYIKKYMHDIEGVTEENAIHFMLRCKFSLNELEKLTMSGTTHLDEVEPGPSREPFTGVSPTHTAGPNTRHSPPVSPVHAAGPNIGRSPGTPPAQAENLPEKRCNLNVDVSNWKETVRAMEKKQPKQITIRAVRNGIPDTFPVDDVAVVAKSAKGCTVWAYFLDTYYNPLDVNTDRLRLQFFLANESLRLTIFYGHLDAATIARLPSTIGTLGLSIGTAVDASAVSSMTKRNSITDLHVAVSIYVATRDLRPLPDVRNLNVHFYGIGDAQVGLIRPAIDALVPKKRMHCLWFPNSLLTSNGVRRLTEELHGVELNRIVLDSKGTWLPREEETQAFRVVFHSGLDCNVQWSMKKFFG